jgi:uncharacterized protein
MHISFDQVRVGPVRWEETVELPAESLGESELLALSPVRCRGTATFVDPSFHLHADLAWVQKLRCDRCLAEFEQEAQVRFDLVLQQVGEAEHEPAAHGERPERRGRGDGHEAAEARHAPEELETLQLEEDDFGVVRVAGDEVSTEPLIAEQVLLSLPMKPLCKPDCAGLCPTCGADRNAEPCQCRPPADERWAGLDAWMQKRS